MFWLGWIYLEGQWIIFRELNILKWRKHIYDEDKYLGPWWLKDFKQKPNRTCNVKKYGQINTTIFPIVLVEQILFKLNKQNYGNHIFKIRFEKELIEPTEWKMIKRINVSPLLNDFVY